MKKTRFAVWAFSLAAVAGCSEAPITAPAMDAPVAYAQATTIQVAGSQTICSGVSNDLSYDGLVWIKAFPTQAQGPYGTLFAGSAWIAPYLDAGITTAPEGTYHFRTQFTLPAGSNTIALNGLVHADNQATIFLNGKQFFKQTYPVNYPNFQDPGDPFSTKSGFVDGVNTVAIDLLNAGPGASAAALDYCFTVTYNYPSASTTPPPPAGDCPVASEIAKTILTGLHISSNSGTWWDVIDRVEKQTKKDGKFDGRDKCDSDYAAKVGKFVADQLHSLGHDDDDHWDDNHQDDDHHDDGHDSGHHDDH